MTRAIPQTARNRLSDLRGEVKHLGHVRHRPPNTGEILDVGYFHFDR